MSQKEKPNLAAALANVSGSTRHRDAQLAPSEPKRRKRASLASGKEEGREVYQAPSRSGTAPITGHFPKQVRNQLKILAIEQNVTLFDLMAEAYNDLFAKYRKPEIAPRQAQAVEVE